MNGSRWRIVSAMAAVSLAVAGCSSANNSDITPTVDATEEASTSPTPTSSPSPAETDGVGRVVTSTRTLGLDVIAAFPGETLVTSPASTVIALSMLGTGADGTAEEQLASLLGAGGEERDVAVKALMGTLDAYRVDPADIDPEQLPDEPKLHLANQAVLSDRAQIKDSYLARLKEWYNADAVVTDLSGPEGKQVLDQWIRENTAGLIKESAIDPSEDLRMVLQNAVLFAAPWQHPFESSGSYEDDFTTGDGSSVTAEFMSDLRSVDYAEVDGWQMIDLPYGTEGALVARYVLPPQGVGLEKVTAEDIATLEAKLTPTDVSILIPKLDLTSSVSLKDPLVKEGLTSVFEADPPALEYISEAEDLYVSMIIQQGRVRLDEEGTVAAATTEIAIEALSAPLGDPKYFTADRPHLVILLDKEVGWDLFQIAVNNPVAQ